MRASSSAGKSSSERIRRKGPLSRGGELRSEPFIPARLGFGVVNVPPADELPWDAGPVIPRPVFISSDGNGTGFTGFLR
ncbi:hypothetical protein PtB15_17B209 [Puccinia triticina]|nr:hypothetical protein PtB15_17B209 [Puccinia triticina]